MTDSDLAFAEQYSAGLKGYLGAASEEALHAAYELGRKALSEGLGVLDMAKVHQRACAGLWSSDRVPEDLRRRQQELESFFMEALSSFEAQHRGFHEANARLQVLNEALEKRAGELAAANRELSHEMTRRRASEEMWKRYESIVNTSREYLSLIASNYRYEAANDAFCRAHGRTREEILGSAVEEIWGQTTFKNIIKTHLDQCFQGEEVHYQAWLEMPVAGRRYLEISYYPYHQRSSVSHAIVVKRDITDRLRAERALRESEEQFRTLMQSAADAIILADSKGTIIACNQAARRMFGRPREEVVGQPISVLVPERYRRAHASGIRRVRCGEPSRLVGRTLEMHGLRRDGSEFPLELSLASWETERGRFYCGIIRDITERKRAEDEIRLLQTVALSVSGAEDLNTALGAVVSKVCEAIGCVVGQAWIPRPDGSCLECSPAWHCAISGAREFRRESESATFRPGAGLPGQAWATRQLVWSADLGQEAPSRRGRAAQKAGLKSGLAIPILAADQAVAVIEFFLREALEEDERTVQLVSALGSQIGMGIQRKRIQEQFDRFFGISVDMLCVAGFDARLRRVNPAWKTILGFEPARMLGTAFFDLVHPDDRAAAAAEFEKLKSDRTTVSFEVRTRGRDGVYRWIQWTASSEPDEQVLYASGRDTTRRKQAEEALRKSEEHYRELFEAATAMQEKLRVLSSKVLTAQEEERKRISRELHDEVGQALTAISVNLQLLKQKPAHDRKDVDATVQETQALLGQTMNNVHRFAYELRPAMLDDLGLVIALRWYIRAYAKRTGIRVNFRADPLVEKLESEPKTVLYRVVQESLNNIYKYARARRAEIVIRKINAGIRLMVKDDGRGFDPNKLNMTTKEKGGLGLMGMQERLRLVNGQLSVASQPSKGTTIQAMIPVKARHLSQRPSQASNPK